MAVLCFGGLTGKTSNREMSVMALYYGKNIFEKHEGKYGLLGFK